MYPEDSLLPISALQHLAVCPRQCALIHIEGAWAENRLTMEGRILHDKVHEAGRENRDGILTVRGLMLRSLRLGLVGKADVVEFHRVGGPELGGVKLPGVSGRWLPLPVEYKRGRPKKGEWDTVQLCAQALCLEEMLGCEIPVGAVFYGHPRRRQEVKLTPELRRTTETAAARLHQLIASGETPRAIYEKKCESCSLMEVCLPKAAGGKKSALRYLDAAITEAQGSMPLENGD